MELILAHLETIVAVLTTVAGVLGLQAAKRQWVGNQAEAIASGWRTRGNTDLWQLMAKASHDKLGIQKSTKVLNLPTGCIIQVTTEIRGRPFEVLSDFIYGVRFDGEHFIRIPFEVLPESPHLRSGAAALFHDEATPSK